MKEMPSKQPKHELSLVKQLVNEFLAGDNTKLWFSARSRSLFIALKILDCSEKEVELKIAEALLKLKDSDFSDNNFQWENVNDIYGLENFENHNWYIKFNIAEDDGIKSVNEISFHPIEKALKLIDGRALEVTYPSKEDTNE